RGELLDDLSQQLQDVDGAAETLVGAESPVLPGRLVGRPVVLVVPDGLPDGALDPVGLSLAAAGAQLPGSVRLTPALDLGDPTLLTGVRERLGLPGASRARCGPPSWTASATPWPR
ncbi:MAG: copper transporter, partial [Actinomycetes bacterium]